MDTPILYSFIKNFQTKNRLSSPRLIPSILVTKNMNVLNMKMYQVFLRIILFVAVFGQVVNTAQAQNGDQILDGIGETGMIARYMFNGDVKDWSRNNLHAKLQGTEAKFVNDNRFGKVLSLSGDSNSFVTIPGEALTDIESLSISGWIYLRSKQPGQRFFDFGKDATRHFFAAPVGTNGQEGYQALITAEEGNRNGASSPAIEVNKWVHLAIVIDVPSKSMVTYVDSRPAGEARNITPELTAVFGQQPGERKLFIGKSLLPADPNLNAMVYDFRIYRVPLNRRQVAGIYNNARGGRGVNEGSVNTTRRRTEDPLPQFSPTEAQLYNAYLAKVSDVEVETAVGNLPRLPAYVEGTYKDGMKGPKVRVVWPAATDNTAVIKPGRYTVTGHVAGTNFQPKAFVTIKNTSKSTTPEAKLEAFDLAQVSLKNDAHGHVTKFIENRDKFISTLAKTDPNSFLYMFRHAFGQQQPEGAKP